VILDLLIRHLTYDARAELEVHVFLRVGLSPEGLDTFDESLIDEPFDFQVGHSLAQVLVNGPFDGSLVAAHLRADLIVYDCVDLTHHRLFDGRLKNLVGNRKLDIHLNYLAAIT